MQLAAWEIRNDSLSNFDWIIIIPTILSGAVLLVFVGEGKDIDYKMDISKIHVRRREASGIRDLNEFYLPW